MRKRSGLVRSGDRRKKLLINNKYGYKALCLNFDLCLLKGGCEDCNKAAENGSIKVAA